MKVCEVKDCGKKASCCFKMPDNDEMIFLCPDCYYHLLNLTNELEVMTWEQKIERLRKITTVKEFENILVELGELPINHRKGNNDNTH